MGGAVGEVWRQPALRSESGGSRWWDIKPHSMWPKLVVRIGLFSIWLGYTGVCSSTVKGGTGLRFDIAGEYGKLNSLDNYNLSHVVEPFRISVLSAFGGGAIPTYAWTIRKEDNTTVIQRQGQNMSLLFECSAPSVRYITLEAKDHASRLNTSITEPVHCLYVRREIHRMSNKDRRAYMSALRLMHDMDGDSGRAMYGPKYASVKEITVMHLDRVSEYGCSPWHAGQVFITSHAAFALMYEQSLQAINPMLAQPYWDYSVEGSMGRSWHMSEMFTDKWFGSWGDAEDEYTVHDGLFAYQSMYFDCHTPEKNSYCLVTNKYNNDKARYLSRSKDTCGLENTGGWATCSQMRLTLKSESLYDFWWNTEMGVHLGLHYMAGGQWACKHDFVTALKIAPGPDVQKWLESVAFGFIFNFWGLMTDGLLVCPDYCDYDTPFAECTCYCPMLEGYETEGNGTHISYSLAMELLESAGPIMIALAESGIEDMVTEEQYQKLMIWLTEYMCNPPRLTPFGGGFAGPADPIFMSLHTVFDWLYHVRILQGGPLDMTWISSTEDCWGHGLTDRLPFHDFFDEHNAYYTNEDLLAIFDPRNNRLSYIYDDFRLEKCVEEDE